jgi:hypothetical protein
MILVQGQAGGPLKPDLVLAVADFFSNPLLDRFNLIRENRLHCTLLVNDRCRPGCPIHRACLMPREGNDRRLGDPMQPAFWKILFHTVEVSVNALLTGEKKMFLTES